MIDRYFSPGEAARRLGITTKALRVYETRGLLSPTRSLGGWRTYGPGQMARAAEIVRLRALGLSLAEIAAVDGDRQGLERALAQRLAWLDESARTLVDHRARLARPPAEVPALAPPLARSELSFSLPWPWQGEKFTLDRLARITFIVGPLGSGKTRLCESLAAALPGGVFIDLARRVENTPASRDDASPCWRIDALVASGASPSDALARLVSALEATRRRPVVVDLVEEGLDGSTQHALMRDLRQRDHGAPVMLMTRSNCILDLGAVARDEAIILCPANHSLPRLVAPVSGAHGYETVEDCLGSPETRARSAGVIAMRQHAA